VSRTLTIATTAILLLVLAAPATATVRADVDKVWVSGTQRSFTVTGPPRAAATTPLFVIAPINPAHPLHPAADAMTKGFRAHDHVVQLPHGRTTYKTNCALTLVVPGPRAKPGKNILVRTTLTPAGTKPLVYAVRLGHMRPLDRASRITAAAAAHLVTTVNTGIKLGCTISAAA
jgi:hypothetical protein